MMKKVILCTGFSLLVFSGFVAGTWGADLAGAETAEQIKKLVTAPGVEAIVIIGKGHKIDLIPGVGITFMKPRTKKGESRVPQNERPEPPKGTPHGELPIDLQYEIPPGEFPMTTIKVYGKETCVYWGGVPNCWP